MNQPLDIPAIVSFLRTTNRMGSAEDKPEGARYIQISDTLALALADQLKAWAEPVAQVDAGDLDALTSAVQDLVDLLNEQHKRENNRVRAYADATETWLQVRQGKRTSPILLAAFLIATIAAVAIASLLITGALQ